MISYFFDAHQKGVDTGGNPIYDREYDASDHANFYKAFYTNGVFDTPDPDACKVTVAGAPPTRILEVAPGRVFANGYQGITVGDDAFDVTVMADGRYRVIIRLDISETERGFSCLLVFGSASAYPALVRDGNIYDLCLANVILASGVPTVEDTRFDPSLCGQVRITGREPLPPYYPPGALPEILWLYAAFRDQLTSQQLDMVEGNPSLMAIYNNSSVGVPSGSILLWRGSVPTIPYGWALCDGNNGTPDLRDRFIVGAGGTYSPGNTGGENSVILTVDQLAAHNHKLPRSASASSIISIQQSSQNGTFDQDLNYVSTVGNNQPHENRPPYYSLAYIMKL